MKINKISMSQDWGKFLSLLEFSSNCKLNQLIINPHQSYTIDKKKDDYDEHFFIVEGKVHLYKLNVSSDFEEINVYKIHHNFTIHNNGIYQLSNEEDTPISLIMIQYRTDKLKK